jgi:predicted DCC family thiol-disulfide oxidoreductase YuxK
MSDEAALIVYDGECILCQSYARLLRLRETVGKVDLVDARSSDPRVSSYWRQGYDLNEGMLFVHRGKAYYGSDALHALAGLSSLSSWFNRLNRALFTSRTASTALYPFLKLGRRLILFSCGKGLIGVPTVES